MLLAEDYASIALGVAIFDCNAVIQHCVSSGANFSFAIKAESQ